MRDDWSWRLLRAADPEATSTHPTPEPVLERILAISNMSDAPSGPRALRRFGRWSGTLGGGLVLASAALACVLVLSGGTADKVQTAAAAVLHKAAATAAAQPATVVAGSGQYLYVESVEGQISQGADGAFKSATMCTQTVQDWAAADGTGRQVSSRPSPGCEFVPSQAFGKGHDVDGEVYPGARSLPADPAQLKRFIVAEFEGGKSEDPATFQFAGTFLQAGATPRVRAALYRMIASFPGVESLGPMTDKLGRRGIGVAMTEYGVRDVLIFDPVTSAVLEREGVVASAAATLGGHLHLPVGAVINYTVYKASGVVNSLKAVP
jgi:hypothetical protein